LLAEGGIVDTLKKVALDAASMPRIKGFLAAGKTPVDLYSLYSEKFAEVEGMTPELLKELQAEVKARIQFAWPEVRHLVLPNGKRVRLVRVPLPPVPKPQEEK
jgi:hypothetical protein